MREIYNVSIRDNAYLKDKTVRDRVNAKRVRQKLTSLEDMFSEPEAPVSQPINLPYTPDEPHLHHTLHVPQTPHTPHIASTYQPPRTPVKVDFSQLESVLDKAPPRVTSSPLLNRLNQIQADRENSQNSNPQKVTDPNEVVWPVPPNYVQSKRRRSLFNVKKISATIGLGLAATFMGLGLYNWNKNEELREAREATHRIEQTPQVYQPKVNPPVIQTSPSPVKIVQPAPITKISQSTLTLQNTLLQASPSVTYSPDTNQDPSVIDLAKQRVQQTKQKIESERIKNSPNNSQVIENKPVSYTPSNDSKPSVDWKTLVLKGWRERALKRSLEANIVKSVTFYPDGKIITSYPNNISEESKFVSIE